MVPKKLQRYGLVEVMSCGLGLIIGNCLYLQNIGQKRGKYLYMLVYKNHTFLRTVHL